MPIDNNIIQTKPSLKGTATKETKQAKLFAWMWAALKYGLLFLLIYTVLNWWRQPIIPSNPNLQLTDYQGHSVNIEAMSHQSPVLVYFWGTWCGVCSITSPTINNLALSYPVVSIAVQSGTNPTLDSYLRNKGFDFTVINDEHGDMFAAWQGQVTPSYVILNNGEMTQGLTGIQPEWSLRLRLWLSAL